MTNTNTQIYKIINLLFTETHHSVNTNRHQFFFFAVEKSCPEAVLFITESACIVVTDQWRVLQGRFRVFGIHT